IPPAAPEPTTMASYTLVRSTSFSCVMAANVARSSGSRQISGPSTGAAMKPARYVPLSAMMFLQYAVWGIWLPVLGQYLQAAPSDGGLGFSGGQVGMILGLAGSIGAVSAPFIAGQIADRYFSTERFLGVLLILGGAVKWITATQTSYLAWLALSIAYSVVYM